MAEGDAAAAEVEEKKEEEAPKGEEAQETKPKGPDYEGVVAGKYNWDKDTPTQKEAELAGEVISKYSWSDGKKAVSIYVEMDGLDDVPDDALKAESGEKEATLTISAIGAPPRKKSLKLRRLANEIDGVKLVRKPGKNTVALKLAKKEEQPWWRLTDDSGSGGGDDDDDGMGGMGGMGGGMDMASMMGGMGGMGMGM